MTIFNIEIPLTSCKWLILYTYNVLNSLNVCYLYKILKRLIWDTNEAFRPIPSKDIAKPSKFQDVGRYPNKITWDFVWVNQNNFLNVSTNFKPVISFVRVKVIFVYLHWNDKQSM